METQKIKMVKVTLNKRRNAGIIMILNFKLYYKAKNKPVIK